MDTKKMLKQGLLVLALMAGAIALFNFGPIAFADLINPSDQPDVLRSATGGEGSIRSLALRIVNYFLTFLGIVAVMMIIFGGVTYVTAAGKQESIDNAKKIILYAILGIIVILLAFAIVNTVLGAATGGDAIVQ
ncbi:hypothetical protein HOE67_04155 [Candidatus Peregrinibacteria bacterium]|jgi:hypothetical protein|nr:hypothetical protein [Candidatus Peregrinibacteria bacterium]MBT4056277.1 hypothetical protein [Candidatus Peregrinibacteria bacterium]